VAHIITGFTEISHILDFLHELRIFRRHKKKKKLAAVYQGRAVA
jgi:type I site-specific restriction-modification system R (restriction) subunit